MPHTTHRRHGHAASDTAAARTLRGAASAAAATAALLGLFSLTACGGSGGAQKSPGVASLPSGPASVPSSSASSVSSSGTAGATGTPGTSGASTTAGGDSRPQERLDDTPEEREALIHAWDVCLVDHGAHWTTTRPGVAGAPKQVADPIPAAAHAACENKLPLLPSELDPARNAHYRDDTLAEIKCLRDHGVMVHLTSDTSVSPDGLSWTYDSDTVKVPDNEQQLENDCQLAAFGGKGR